jgi:hypothetical protein
MILTVIQSFDNVVKIIGFCGFGFIIIKIVQFFFEPSREYQGFNPAPYQEDIEKAETATPIRGADVTATVEIKETVATLGGLANVRFSTGREFSLNIPAGTKRGTCLRLTGVGLPGANGGENGNGLVTVVIASPHEEVEVPISWGSSTEDRQSKSSGPSQAKHIFVGCGLAIVIAIGSVVVQPGSSFSTIGFLICWAGLTFVSWRIGRAEIDFAQQRNQNHL